MTRYSNDFDWGELLDDQGAEYWEHICWPADALVEDHDLAEYQDDWDELDHYTNGPEEDTDEEQGDEELTGTAAVQSSLSSEGDEVMADWVAWEQCAERDASISTSIICDDPRGRQHEILAWLQTSELARSFRSRDGFYIPGGSTVVLLNGRELDAILWLLSEGFVSGVRIEGFEVAYSGPESPWGERLSFFRYRVEAPF
ncbi:MAG: hypothetical protein D6720_07795 [Gammaproteobacteria bacterium]|nr:MAG: hypothetical protein D6720_07795 [Gammaproteobacteria bacterium]